MWSGRRAAGADGMIRRFTLGEENDATGNQTLISLEGEVTAQVEVNSSC
jgi:hypothetical protein